ncbi:MAG: hypothetical protein IK070_01685, partial [Clostridia bacterium]|nr:hypothetical protein [Clostridia bacterium]
MYNNINKLVARCKMEKLLTLSAGATNAIIIGDALLTGRWVTITDNSHGDTSIECLKLKPIARSIVSKGPVKIGNNVWIGDKATILPNVTIG